MKGGSVYTTSFRRIHFLGFRHRWFKSGFTGPKTFRGFRETGPRCRYDLQSNKINIITQKKANLPFFAPCIKKKTNKFCLPWACIYAEPALRLCNWSVSFPELRSPWPAVGKRELCEYPFQACAIACNRCRVRLRSEPDSQNSVISQSSRFPTAGQGERSSVNEIGNWWVITDLALDEQRAFIRRDEWH